MIRIPNLYLLSTLFCVIALFILVYTQIDFVIVFMVLGTLAYLPNFWIGSQYGLKVTLFVKENEPQLYKIYKSNFKYKGVFFLSPKAHKSKVVMEKLEKEQQYALKKYAQAVGNIKYTFILFIISLLLASYFILN